MLSRLSLSLSLALACGNPIGERSDAAARDASSRDARLPDAPRPDAPTPDARAVDAPGLDAPAPDAPRVDTGPPSCTRARADLSDPPESASWRFGGGHGYPDAVRPDDPCTTIVRTLAELEAALAIAEAEDTVYVADDADIELGTTSLCIPAGVTLASGRGTGGSAGARLHFDDFERVRALRACGDDVRITGLRLHGPEPTQCPPQYPDACEGVDRTGGVNCRDCMPNNDGIYAAGFDRLEVDNNELAGWSFGAVRVQDGVDHHVHHNHIHHTQRQGLGYGVVLTRSTPPTEVLIEYNRFDYNRHAVAGSGEMGQSYTARFNVSLEHANGHVYDMHGQNEGTDDGTPWAGDRIQIHDNTVLPTNAYAAVIRGRPATGAWFHDNCLARSSSERSFLQRFFTGNFHPDRSPSGAAPNRYGQSRASCHPPRFCIQTEARGPIRYLARSSYGLGALGVADFDGDGRADLLRTEGGEWHWLSGGTGGWTRRNVSGTTLASMRFGDFDGDGADDVFVATGSEFRISSGAAGRWTRLRAATDAIGTLRFGDFDGDGRTDVFRANGTDWEVSDGGSGAWRRLNRSGFRVDALGFGDFDGDGRTDVFSTSGGQWRISRGGASGWEAINTAAATVADLAFADVTGDGRTDVISRSRDTWRISESGTSRWRTWAVTSRTFDEVHFADFDGDGTADAFRTGCL